MSVWDTVAELLGPHADSQKITDTVVAAGVAAARGARADVFSEPGLFAARPSLLGGSVLPLVSWRDPRPWLLRLPDDALWVADAWQIAAPSWPRIRLLLSEEDTGAGLAARLAPGTAVAAVVHGARMADPAEIPRWSWPLRLAVPHQSGEPALRHGLLAAAEARAELVRPVASAGRWNRSSLLLLTGPEEIAAAATAVVTLAGSAETWPGTLRDLGSRHRAAVAAAAYPGRSPQRWLEVLLALLAQDLPLDVALWQAAEACAAPPPAIAADQRFLDSTRIRPLLAAFPAQALSAAEEGRIGRALRGGAGPGPAAVIGATAGQLRAAAHRARRLASRFLRAALVEADGVTAAGRIAPHREFRLRIGIMADPQARPGEQPFPADALPPGPVHRLTVLATDLTPGAPTVRQAQIELPGEGDSSAAVLRFQAGPPGSAVEIGVAVLFGARFLQAGVLTGHAGGPEPPVFRLDAVVRASTDDLGLAPPYDAAMLVSQDTAGTPVVAAHAGSQVTVRAPDNLRKTVDVLLGALRLLTTDAYRPGGYRDPQFAGLLIEVARRGRALRKSLFPERDWKALGELRDARSVSVLSASPGGFLPLELLYDRPLATEPGRRLRLCPHAPSLLDRPGCAGCPEREQPAVVCPFGFWGASKVIERHVRSELSDSRFAIAVSPDIDRHACVIDPVCAAASDRADHNDAAAWTTAVDRLGLGPPGTVRVAADWAALGELIRTARRSSTPPGAIFLVPHSEVGDDGIGVLSLGENDRREITDGLEFLFAGDGGPEPLVLVLGCATAGGATLFSDASAMLLSDGAPGVVATLVPVLGRHIVPVGVALLRELRAAAARPEGSPLGEALLRARRRLLADGDACVLALAGFGDTDWQLRAEPERDRR
jgi:hypothetical protein